MEIDNTSEAVARFRKKLESYAPISYSDFQRLADAMHEKHFEKGEVLLREGQVCRLFYFIVSGCVRKFGLENGRELNVKFYFEDDLSSDFDSFRREKPSQFNLVTMEDTTVYYAVKTEILPIFRSDISFYIFLFRFFQDMYFKEREHSNTFKLLSPEQRYQFLLEHEPHYLQRIPLIHLAPYLGMSRETLTRIRRKIT